MKSDVSDCLIVASEFDMTHWWSRFPLLYDPIRREDVDRGDFPTFHGRIRIRIEPIDPIDICSDLTPKERLWVEFDDDIDDELWCLAYQSFCIEGGFVEEDEDENELGSNFAQGETGDARTIFNEFHPEGTIIMITNLYEYVIERHSTTVDIFFWQPRNPQSQCRLRNALARWRDYLEKATAGRTGGVRARIREALLKKIKIKK